MSTLNQDLSVKGKEEGYYEVEEHTHQKPGLFTKLTNFITGTSETTVLEEENTKVRVGPPKEVSKEERVIDESIVAPNDLVETVVEEKDILAPVEHRKVVEQRRPREHIRIIEEVTKLEYPVIAEKELRKLVDTKEVHHDITRKVVKTEDIRVPVERHKIIEEVWQSESVRLVEETAPIISGAVDTELTETKELSAEVQGPEVKTEVTGVRTYVGKPSSSTVRDDFEVPGLVGTRKIIEEIEIVEYHRFYEETEQLAQALPDEDIIKQHRSQKFL